MPALCGPRTGLQELRERAPVVETPIGRRVLRPASPRFPSLHERFGTLATFRLSCTFTQPYHHLEVGALIDYVEKQVAFALIVMQIKYVYTDFVVENIRLRWFSLRCLRRFSGADRVLAGFTI